MNKLLRLLLSFTALGGLAVAVQAQPAPKVLVIDMAKALDSYYKWQDSKAKLSEVGQKAQDQLDEKKKEMQALADQVKDLMEQSKNTVLKAEVRSQAESDAQKKMGELQQRQQDAENFLQSTRAQLQQRLNNYRELLMEDIKNAASTVARARGATLVLDKGGPSLIGTPAVIYADSSYDITDDVLKDLNKDRPPAPAAASTTPAASATPSSTAAPAPAPFTVPNVTPAKKP
ncbi:MAG TPA: OmpH family outer membrane protein [Candidatus Didemnitutus sp.]|nr:OmpH family outer membrane protein [Candidatus Didemnitutus sp.]